MYKNHIIKKILTAFILVIFSISITPTIVFHNLFASHTDTFKKTATDNTQQVGKKLFNCHCDNIVAESPFTRTGNIIIPTPCPAYTTRQENRTIHLFSSPVFYYSLRGPPVV